MNIHSFAASDRGRRRESNEDHYLIDESLGLYVVCDGIGGHAAGEVAAERSVAFAAEYIRARRDVLDSAGDSPDGYFRVLELAEDATQEASRRLYELACSDSAYAGMGTTMTIMLVVNNKAIMAHVGDSRLCMLRRGELHQLSSDHTLANERLQAGALTREEAANSKYNHVLTRTIGQQELVQVESLLFDLFPGDTCLLCSDGLSNYFDDPVLSSDLLPGDCVGESFLLRGGKVDASVVADRPSRLLFIPRSQFGKLTRQLPKLGNALLGNLGRHLSEELNHIRSLKGASPGDTATWERGPG